MFVSYTIAPKDVQRLTNKSERTSRALIAKIKATFCIEKGNDLPVDKFCEAMKWNEEKVRELLSQKINKKSISLSSNF